MLGRDVGVCFSIPTLSKTLRAHFSIIGHNFGSLGRDVGPQYYLDFALQRGGGQGHWDGFFLAEDETEIEPTMYAFLSGGMPFVVAFGV